MATVAPGPVTATHDKISHLCRHAGCDRWGTWGYDAGEGVIGWWCLEHRPDRDPIMTPASQSWVSDGNEG